MDVTRTIAMDDPGRLSVYLFRGLAVQSRLNGSRSCLGGDSLGPNWNIVADGRHD